MTFGSLFAGIGGFDLGLERAGMRCAWQVEIDRHCRAVLARHWPDRARHEDVRAVGAGTLAPADLVCGGFPCQDLSVAGRRARIGGARSGLFYEMARVIDELRPAWLLWENVPGLLSSGAGRDFLAVLAHLDGLGYAGAWTTVDARYFGLAQQRRRIFGLFAAGGVGARGCAEILALAARLPGNPAPGGAPRPDLAASLRSRSAGGGGNLPGRGGEDDTNLAFALRRDPGGIGQGHNTNFVPDLMRTLGSSPTYERGDGGLEVVAVPALAPCLQERDAKGQDSDATKPLIAFNIIGGAQHSRSHAYETERTGALQGKGLSASGNEAGTVVAATLNSGGNAGGFHTEPSVAGTLRSNPHNNSDAGTEARMHIHTAIGVRRLTPTECERLQGFPDGWTDGAADTHRYRMLGNAVPVPVAEWIGRRLVSHLTEGVEK